MTGRGVPRYFNSVTIFSPRGDRRRFRVDRVRLGQLQVWIGEPAISLVAAERVQQVPGQQRPDRTLRPAVWAWEPQHLRQSSALNQTTGSGFADDA